eukprot:4413231-Ditylum_brightwellii.AAC.1
MMVSVWKKDLRGKPLSLLMLTETLPYLVEGSICVNVSVHTCCISHEESCSCQKFSKIKELFFWYSGVFEVGWQ